MANLYEIDEQILSCIDAETGEIIDVERLTELTLARETKIENVALWVKNLRADAAMYKAEKEAFAEREKAATHKAENLEEWLTNALNGDKFSTSKVSVSFRKSKKVYCDITKLSEEYIRYKVEKAADKIALKKALEKGERILGAALLENQNIQIK